MKDTLRMYGLWWAMMGLNVSIAGSIVMMHRLLQRSHA